MSELLYLNAPKPTRDLEDCVFEQLLFWLQAGRASLSDYQEILAVAPRRYDLQSKVWRRKSDSRLVVLKSFNRLDFKMVRRAVLNELVIPHVLGNDRILKPTVFFVDRKVGFGVRAGANKRFFTSSTPFWRAWICGTSWSKSSLSRIPSQMSKSSKSM